ncbi:unnamed protein product [Parascedosporium putredinis]|uniref:Uncharacterized protein n=1 Tax=Parascedosporium putredinis TaxID=1442378 RepID=A0A9P1MAP3_9PEZI|nr:unnamed protein product [Parascedosporium putredinis]CAI7994310.1 unnamed protein product [Parascedosporium putredinis]
MSQVKNLRAMFENKGDAPNPPERGRTLTPSSKLSSAPSTLSRIFVAERTESIAAIDDPIKVVSIPARVSEPAVISTQPPAQSGPPNEPVVSVLTASPRKATTGPKREGTPDAAANVNGRQADPPNSLRKEARDAPAKRKLEAKPIEESLEYEKAPFAEEPITEDMVRAAKEAASNAVAIAPVTCEGTDPRIMAGVDANLGPTRDLSSSSELPPVETDFDEQAPPDEGSNAVSSLNREDTAVPDVAGPVLDELIGVDEPVAIDESVGIDEPDNTVPIQPEPIILEQTTPIVTGVVNSVITPTTDVEQGS